jgi:sulfofructose kinase
MFFSELRQNEDRSIMSRIVCFGPINPVLCVAVDKYPVANSGAFFSQKWEAVGGDSANVAWILARWGATVQLIGNDLGDDEAGSKCIRWLESVGINHNIRLRHELDTPFEFDVSDKASTRTWFVEYNQSVWDTLLTANLADIEGADLLYIDWYVAAAAAKVVDRAAQLGVPVLLNIEQMYSEPEIAQPLIKQATYCQATVEEGDRSTDPLSVAMEIRKMGAQEVLVTLGSKGCLGVNNKEVFRLPTDEIHAVDTNGAGSVFSAGFVYAHLQGKSFLDALQFANAAATLKCMRLGPADFSLVDVEQFMKQIC